MDSCRYTPSLSQSATGKDQLHAEFRQRIRASASLKIYTLLTLYATHRADDWWTNRLIDSECL